MSEIIDCMVWVVQKTCWSMWQFTKFVSLRVLDLIGLVCNVLACLTIIRLPCMIRQFQEMDSMSEWRYVGLVQFLIFLMDIPVIIMGLLCLAITFGLILIPFCRKLSEEDIDCDYTHKEGGIYFGGCELRCLVTLYFLRLMCDIFCIPLGFIVLLSWRSVRMVKQIREEENDGWEGFTWRKICVVEFVHLVLDIPCLLLWLVVMVTWRAPFIVADVKEAKSDGRTWNSYRFLPFLQILILLADIFFMILFIFTICTWRAPFLIYDFFHPDDYDLEELSKEWQIKAIIAYQALLVLVDIPCILCVVIVFVTLWRIPNFIRHSKKDEWQMRKNCVWQVAMLCLDFLLLLLNILCLVSALICLTSIWRAYPLVKDIRKYCRQRSEAGREWDEENPPADYTRDATRKERKKRQAKITWKMRLAACKHVLFLLIDIPAIVLCFFILVTVFRFPKLLSKLLQAGNFYLEFAVTVYTEFIKLIVDVVFFLLFLVLMILRPIQSWVHLLEDEDHQHQRLLRFYMQWVPDILDKRHQMYRELEEVFSTCLKEKALPRDVRTRMSHVTAEYLKDLQWIRDKVKKHELDEEFGHLVGVVQFYECKRPDKMGRLYKCESNFIQRPHLIAHNDNLRKYSNEMQNFEAQVSAAITAVEEFKIRKVPLWVEQCGLITRTRKETQRVLIKCLPSGRFLVSLLILLNLLFIYRGPWLIRNLCRRWYNRRKIVFTCLKEYLKDLLTVLIILLVMVTLYKAPFLLVEISNDIISKRSWKAVRQTVKRYPPQMGRDLVDFLVTLLSWETIRFFFTAIVFGILMPAHLFLTVMKFLFGKGFCAAFTTGLLYVIFFGFPFALAYKLAQTLIESGQGNVVSISVGVFGIFLSTFLIFAAALTFRNRENTFSVRPKDYDYVRFNWTNAHVLIFEFVEFLQVLALVFSLSDIPMYGAATLRDASQYLLLNFATFDVKFWLTTVLFICWFFICGLPVILEQVIGSTDEGTFQKQVSWMLLVSMFSNTLFVTILESFLSFVACSYNLKCPRISPTVNSTGSANNTSAPHCASTVLVDDTRVECWAGEHQGIAVFGLVALVWYATTAIIFGTRYGDSDHPSQDLKFSPIYNVFINILKAVMVGVVVLAVSSPYIALSLLIAVNLMALLFTLIFKRVVGFSLSNSFVLLLWRAVTFVCGIIAAIAAIVALIMGDGDSYVPLGIFLGGIGLVLLVAIVVSIVRVVKRDLTPVEQQRKTFRAQLLQLESKLLRENYMVNSWSKYRKQWRRLLRHVYEAQKNDGQLRMRHNTFDFPEEILPPSDNEPDAPPPPPVDEFVASPGRTDADDIPPPPYEELFPHIMGPYGPVAPPPYSPEEVPQAPPPAYSEIPSAPPGPDGDLSPATPTEEKGAPSAAAFSEDTEGDVQMLSNLEGAVGFSPGEDERRSSAVAIEMTIASSGTYGSVQLLDETLGTTPKRRRSPHPVQEMECNGKNLLLVLEQHIHYSAFSFAFLSQIPLWRSVVRGADWTKLLECLRHLESSLNGTFNAPSRVDQMCGDIAVEILRLEPDPDKETPPVFVPESRDPEVIRAQSDAERYRFLAEVRNLEVYGEKWAQVLDKVLPTLPVYRKCSWDTHDKSFTLTLRRAVRGTIINVGPRGIKMARGASIYIPKVVKGQFLSLRQISFEKGSEPKGSKGPVSVVVSELEIVTNDSGDKTYIGAQGKRVGFDKALDCLHEVQWK